MTSPLVSTPAMSRPPRRLARAPWILAALALGAWAFPALASPPRIIGGLGNFDCPNDNSDDCNEFEIEIEGPHPEDVIHTYRNGNYGSPIITALPGNVGVRLLYTHPNHATRPHTIEHFGVVFRGGSPRITAQRFGWHLGTVVGPTAPPTPPPPPPPPPLAMPTVEVEVLELPTGSIVRETVTNHDTFGRAVWVMRRETTVAREVNLEELMPNDPLIQGSNQLDAEPEFLPPGMPLVTDEPAPSPGDTESQVITYDVFSNVRQLVGGDWIDAPGSLITTLLTAQVTVGGGCNDLPYFDLQPVSAAVPFDGGVEFSIAGVSPGNGGELFYQWRHEGVDMPGEDTPILGIDPVTYADAGAYTCVIHNDCGMVISEAAHLTVNEPCDILHEPVDNPACPNTGGGFAVSMSGVPPFTFHWFKNNAPVNMSDPRLSLYTSGDGKTGTLWIDSVRLSDAGSYYCTVSAACGTFTTGHVDMIVCAADMDNGTGTGTCDGGVTIDDLLYYLTVFEEGALRADIDDGSGTGTLDGGVTVDDLLYYLTRFEAGC